MNISAIKEKAVTIAASIYRGFREALRLPYAKTYMGLSVILILIFTAATFPYEIIIRNKIQGLEKTLFRNVYVGNMDFSIFGPSTLDNVYVTTRRGSDIILKNMTVNPTLNPVALFIRNIYRTDMQVSGIRIKSSGFQADLNLNGNIYLKMRPSSSLPDEGTVTMMVQNAIVQAGSISLPPDLGGITLDIPSIRLTSIIFDSQITGADMKIKRFTISGPDLRGEVSGSVVLNAIVQNSKLELLLSIDSASQLLANYRDFLVPYIDEDGKIFLTMKGTISHPDIKIRKK